MDPDTCSLADLLQQEVENTPVENTPSLPPKRRGRPKTSSMTEDEKKRKQAEYYQRDKEHRLKYKQTRYNAQKIPSNQCFMDTHYIPRYIRQEKKKPRVNIDWIKFGGMTRSLHISQPSEELLHFIRTNLKITIEETVRGVPDDLENPITG